MYKHFNDYRGEYEEYKCPKWYMLYYTSYYRRIRTQQEIRRWYKDIKEPVKLRGRRNPWSLNSWNLDKVATCYGMKSWKKLYRKRKQWM